LNARNATHRTPFHRARIIRDVVIGMSDGLTVPFALAAEFPVRRHSPHASTLVVTAGLAEIAAGSIAMGPAATLPQNRPEHYNLEREREVREIVELRYVEVRKSQSIPRLWADGSGMALAVKAITGNDKAWVDFMMWFGYRRATASARARARHDRRRTSSAA
jgi:hypothetical protein